MTTPAETIDELTAISRTLYSRLGALPAGEPARVYLGAAIFELERAIRYYPPAAAPDHHGASDGQPPVPIDQTEGKGPDFAALATAVSARRGQLGLSQQGVAKAGGPSDTTQSKIELQTATKIGVVTLSRYDTALQWPAGTANRLLNGGSNIENP